MPRRLRISSISAMSSSTCWRGACFGSFGDLAEPRPTLRREDAPADPLPSSSGPAATREPRRGSMPADDGGAPAVVPASLLLRYDGCRGHGLYDGLEVRRLTPGVLEPVLVPPFSGALSADVRRALTAR